MYLPIQSEPVQRSTVGQPSPYAGGANGDAAPGGVVVSEHGIDPSGFDLGSFLGSILPPIATTLGSLI